MSYQTWLWYVREKGEGRGSFRGQKNNILKVFDTIVVKMELIAASRLGIIYLHNP